MPALRPGDQITVDGLTYGVTKVTSTYTNLPPGKLMFEVGLSEMKIHEENLVEALKPKSVWWWLRHPIV